MDNILFYLLFLTTCLFSFSNASRDIPNKNTASTKVSAEELIKSFNLNPKHSAAIQSISVTDISNDEAKLVERPINIISSLSAGATTAQLGHYAGYYQLPKTYGARFFYFFFESRHSKSDPVVIWLTGGPGCSSSLALFYENGPFHLSKNLSLIWNDYGWDKASNIIFVDQPTGTGFSYTTDDRDFRHDEASVSNDLYNFLQGFFAKHPEYVANDFYVTGESYAGHYVPALGGRVHQGNKANEGIHINLKGIAVGNGLTDPIIQYNSYADYGLATKLITTKSDYDDVNALYPNCQQAINLCEETSSDKDCQMAFSTCNEVFDAVRDINPQINYYDIRKICHGSLCYDFSGLEKYLNEKTVKEALGVPASIDFVSCSSKVYNAMIDDWVRNLEVGIPTLLEDGIKVLIYAGEYDLICNWLGNYRWVHAMEWYGQKDFVVAQNQSFIVDGKAAGVLKSHGDLSFLKVYNAGHMVPMDQPKAALEMLIRWTQGTLAS